MQEYMRRGLRLVFYPTRTKAPRYEDWPTRITTPDDYQSGDNVGVILGTNIAPPDQPPRYLIDIDFDSDISAKIARRLLPQTGFVFGRGDRPMTHALYTVSTPVQTRFYEAINEKHYLDFA